MKRLFDLALFFFAIPTSMAARFSLADLERTTPYALNGDIQKVGLVEL